MNASDKLTPISTLTNSRWKTWHKIELRGNVHDIPTKCPACGADASVEQKEYMLKGAGNLRTKQTFYYCNECHDAVKAHQNLQKMTLMLMMLPPVLIFGVAILIGLLVFPNRPGKYMPIVFLIASIVSVVSLLLVGPIFQWLRKRAQAKTPQRQGQVVWGPAVCFFGFTSDGNAVYYAANSEWANLLKSANAKRAVE